MATRVELSRRKQVLVEDLRGGCRGGTWSPGEMMPSVSELARRYGLSPRTVHIELRKLGEEGVLHTVAGVGTFAGAPASDTVEAYLLVRPVFEAEYSDRASLQVGFEERIAQLGGHTLSLTREMALDRLKRGELPPLAGIFDFVEMVVAPELTLEALPRVPRVSFATWGEESSHSDIVDFDQIAGGRHATQHLWRLGHRRIAYLGVHSSPCEPDRIWSDQREQGWREVMQKQGLDEHAIQCLTFYPQRPIELNHRGYERLGREFARIVEDRPDISALVVATDAIAIGLLQEMKAMDVPPANLPAIVGFGNEAHDSIAITTMRFPWEEVGRAAADLLWGRHIGSIQGLPQSRLVSMRLLSRLSCRSDLVLPAESSGYSVGQRAIESVGR